MEQHEPLQRLCLGRGQQTSPVISKTSILQNVQVLAQTAPVSLIHYSVLQAQGTRCNKCLVSLTAVMLTAGLPRNCTQYIPKCMAYGPKYHCRKI